MPTVPPFHGSISFNAHHSPMGAFLSFTCGNFNTRGGLAAQLGKPANQNIYIGVKDGDRYANTPLRCLPFFDHADKAPNAMASFLVEQAAAAPAADGGAKLTVYAKDAIKRHYGWASDTWQTPDLSFGIHTPFGEIKDPAAASSADMRSSLLPAVIAELRVDNTKGTQTKTGFFSLGFSDTGAKIIDQGLDAVGSADMAPRFGFSLRDQLGVAGCLLDSTNYQPAADKPFLFMRSSPVDAMLDKDNPIHHLGNCPGIAFEVPPGKCYSLILALGCYLRDSVTTRLEGKYLYTRYYSGLTDVLNAALTDGYVLFSAAAERDQELLASSLNPDQQFLIAHATRSYYGSTQLLDVGGQPYWIVNEGEYCMLNTLDLSVDHVFWELKHNPWVVKNILDNFLRYYSYTDHVKDPKTGQLSPGGISFCHDQGVHNQFSPLGNSSYEMTNLSGCFSYMTAEQLCNWSLIAASYVAKTNDMTWLSQNAGTIKACLESMHRRCPDGIVSLDSSRCGRGAEITTYDSLDHSLAQTRNNVYMAVKGLATYEGLCFLLTSLGETQLADSAHRACRKACEVVAANLRPEGFIPAVFEPDNPGYNSRILPAVEGLVYVLYWADCQPQGWGQFLKKDFLNESAASAQGKLLQALRKHTVTLLAAKEAGLNRFADGGVKLSSTSNNSWMSKIALFEHVARDLFNLDESGNTRKAAGGSGWEKSDAAHTQWQTEGRSAYWACSDQIVSGVAEGSKYYPRIVTTVLWLPTQTK